MLKNIEILPFFLDPEARNSQLLLNNIIEVSYQIALKYLRYHQNKIINILNREDITLKELAIDSIAELFVETESEGFILLKETFSKWEPKIETEEEALFFLNKVVAGKVEQHIFKLLKEEDPFFSKLLDSVYYLVKKNGFHKIHFMGKTFITENESENFEKCFISPDEFEKLPTILFQKKGTLLDDLFGYLKNETDFNPAIPLNDLINRLKHINFSEYLVNEFVINEYRKLEVNEIVQEGFKSALEKLTHSYVEKGKLNFEEQKAFESALKEMANDLCDGGINPGFYNYLFPHFSGLSEIDYKTKYHNILEYLLKVMKSNIAEKLTEKD